ncbi:MAG: UDP-3-O-acyl-N-acetylglucosamine deacetylase, partial [Planctomycetes bacterium]|nr:UDP-3-O-acyl-N-acetylglucosamine deacetylase [Planctomycetota bacterium]
VLVRAGGATLALHPAAPGDTALRATYRLDYGPAAAIPPQAFTAELCPDTFARDVAPCRTFLTQAESVALKKEGVGVHLEPADVLVFGPRGPIDNRLRFADEPARHKVLDLVGDLALCGFDLAGHAVAYRSGHALNVELARTLSAPPRPAKRAA